MRPNLTVTGGARIGWVNASWPLAKLSVSKGILSIRAFVFGEYNFAPDEVVALEVYRSFPIIGRGVRVVHSRSDYPETIIFWCFRDPAGLIDDIHAAGFQARAHRGSRPRHKGIPIRWAAIAAIVIVWNLLFLLDGVVPWNPPKPPGAFVLLALGIMFVLSVSLPRSAIVQAWVMKPGRSVTEIASFATLLQIVSGFLLIGFSLFHFLGPQSVFTGR